MTNYVKKPVSILLAILMVVSLFTIVPFTANAAETDTASVGSGRVITWSGDTLKYAMSYHDVDNFWTGPDTAAGITVDYEGGARNDQSGFYNIITNDSTGAVSKLIRLNRNSSVLKFTSAAGNAFITKIVINYEDYYNVLGESASTRSLYVNHEAWSYAEAGSTGNYTLTLEGPAARTVALRTGNHYNIRGITSISFYITEDLYTTPDLESGFSVEDLEDGGLKIVNGNPSWPRVGVPFIVRSGGKIAGFSQDDENETTSYSIANPTQAFTFEVDDNSDTMWVDNADDFILVLGLERCNKIYLSGDLTFDSGFEITKSVSIDLKGHSLTCDSSAADKTIRVTGGNSTVTSTGYYWYNIVNGDISGFDKIEVTGGSLTLKGGRYDLPEGFSGNVRLTGGLYKLNDAVDMNKLTASAVNHLPAETDGGWAKLDFHVHDYNTIFEERSDGSIYYINRCDKCGDTVSEWTLTEEEINTLIELNGGTLTSVTEWNYLSPGSAKLYLRITEDTYNTAIAAPYNMNADALKMIRDTGILGSWVTHGAWTNYSTLNGGYSSDDVDITFAGGVRYVGVGEPMSVTSKNGKNICRAVIHIDEYYKDRTNLAYINRGNAIISDDALTITVTNINSDSFTFNFRGESYSFVPVESVDLCYTDSDQKLGYVTVSTTPDADNCDGYTANYDYRGRTHTVNFTGAYYAHHHLDGEPTWTFTEDGDNVRASATQVCPLCGEEVHLGVGYFVPSIEEATYTKEKVRIWSFFASQSEYDVLAPKEFYKQYEQVIGPKIPTTRYTLEDENGVILEYYQDESTGEYFLDLEGSAVPYEDIRLPETKVEAVEATEDAYGNIEYYICSNGRYFKIEDGKYVEIPENAWVTRFGEYETIDLKHVASVFTGQNAKVTCDGYRSTPDGIELSVNSTALITALNGKRIKAIEVTRSKYKSFAGDIYIKVDGNYIRDYTPIGGDTFAFSNLYASQIEVLGDFNLFKSVKVWCVDGPNGGSGEQGTLTVTTVDQITADMAANMNSVSDMPADFVQTDLDTAKTWTGAPKNGRAFLSYAIHEQWLLMAKFENGVFLDSGYFKVDVLSMILDDGHSVYYITGTGSGGQGGSGEQGEQGGVTASQMTADMAANIHSVSDMPSDFVSIDSETAKTWIVADPVNPVFLIYATDNNVLKVIDFEFGKYAEEYDIPVEELPDALQSASIYYVTGDGSGSGGQGGSGEQGEQGGVTASQITADMAANIHSVSDMPSDFVSIDSETAKTWIVADPVNPVFLIYATDNNVLKVIDFECGKYADEYDIPVEELPDALQFASIYYVTGDGSGSGGQGGSGEQVTVTASQITADMAANMNSVSDMPGDFMQVNQASAQAWTGAPQEGWAHLIYAIDGDNLMFADFSNGECQGSGYAPVSELAMAISYGEVFYYVTGTGSGGQGEQGGLTASQITADMAANINSVSDMPADFVQVDESTAQTWTGAPQEGWAHLIYAIDGDNLMFADFSNGECQGSGYAPVSELAMAISYGEVFYYVTGTGSGEQGEQGGVTASQITADMAANIHSVSDMPSDFVSIDSETAKTWIVADPVNPVFLIYATDNNVLKVIDFECGKYADEYDIPVEELPDALQFASIYYVTGDGSGSGGQGGSGEQVTVTASQITADMAANMNSVSDMPGDFVQIDLDTAQTWTGAPQDGWAHLIFAIDEDNLIEAAFQDGSYLGTGNFSVSDLAPMISKGEIFYYVTGGGSGSGGQGGSDPQVTYTKADAVAANPNMAGNYEYYSGSDGKYYEKQGDNYVEHPLDYFTIPKVTVTYHAAVAATPNAEGSKDYYSGSDGKYYEKISEFYEEHALDWFTIPKVTVTRHAAVAATATTAGNSEYYSGSDGKYYVNHNGTYEEIAENSWIIPATGGSGSGGSSAVTLLDEGFENVADNARPAGWTVDGGDGWDYNWKVMTGGKDGIGANSGSKNVCSFQSDSDGTANLYTPAFDLSSYDSAQLSFAFRTPDWGDDIDTLTVYYRVNGGDWISVYSGTSTEGWTLQAADLPAAALAGNVQFRFENNSGYGYGVCLDDVKLTAIGSEPQITYTLHEAVEPTYTSAGNSEYYSGSDGKYYVNHNGTYEEIAENSWIIPATGGSGSGGSSAVTLLDEGFENVADNALPAGWTVDGGDGWEYNWKVMTGGKDGIGANSGSKNVCSFQSDSDGTANLYTPAFDLSSYDSAQLSFAFRTPDWGDDIDTLTVYYRVNGGDWISVYSGTSTEGWTLQAADLPAAALAGNVQFRFENNSGYGYGVCLDDVKLTAIGSEPQITYTLHEAVEPTYTSAGNSEYYSGSDGKYYVNHNGTYEEIAENSWIIPATGGSGSGGSSAVTLLDEGFENVADNALPAGWTVDGGDGWEYNWKVMTGGEDGIGTNSGSKNVCSFQSDSDGTANLYTPAFDLSSYDSAQLSFAFRTPDWGYDIDTLTVYYRVNGGDWISVYSGTSTEGWTLQAADLPAAALAGNVQFRFENNSGYGYGVCLDDVKLTAIGSEPQITYTLHEAVEPTYTSAGNSEYYTGSDGKFYVKDGDNYTEIAENSWIIPKLFDGIYREGTANVSELKVGDILLQGVTIYCDKLNDVNGWNWFLYSDIRPYSADPDHCGITGLSTNASAPRSYVVENNFKVLSIYNHEIKMEENVPLVVKDNGVVVKLTKTAAKAATASTAGNTEYYTGDDGKYYVNNNGTYEEIAENSWVIPALGYTVTWKNGEKVLETDEHVAAGTVPSYDGDAPTKEGCTFAGWTDGENTYGINDALPEVTGDVTYTAVFTYNDGVGAKVIGHSISLNGDVAVNFYMELAPEIAQSETAYMHFTIPNGTKTTELDVPVSQATVNGNYYVFKCNVAAKDMNATVTARIIDGETLGDEYTYSVKGYADYLLTNADANGTELQQAYAAAAPLVEKMLNYGAYAQKYFAPDTTDDDLANVGHVVDISGVTAETIGKSTYTKELNGVAEFSGATLSLKSQTTLSLYFTSDVDLTFNCAHEFEVEKKSGYQIIRIRNIHAKNLMDDFTVTVSDGANSGTISYSPMNYCYNVLNDENQSETLQNVCKALYLYADAADDYFPD